VACGKLHFEEETLTTKWPHGGNLRQFGQASGISSHEIRDFSANMNPLGFPEWLRPLVHSSLDLLAHYPDPFCSELLAAAAERYAIPQAELLAGNGSSELLSVIPRALGLQHGLLAQPCYAEYAQALTAQQMEIHSIALLPDEDFSLDFAQLEAAMDEIAAPTLVILGRPNNPTGKSFCADAMRALAERHPDSWFVIDEAFADFVPGFESLTRNRPQNLVVLLSLTKIFAVPGLRIGLMAAEPEFIAKCRAMLPPWSVNTLAQIVSTRALQDVAYLQKTQTEVAELRKAFAARLAAVNGLRVFVGEANFLLLSIEHSRHNAETLADALLAKGFAIRRCANFPRLDASYFRLAVRREEENLALCEALEVELQGAPAILRKLPVPAIMLQATSSNAGKSILATALCRILLQDGYHVAPFKAQNMSLNSAVTRDGLEIGRAQALQAQACRLDADVRMNPVLLKPNSETGSQVIVMGHPIANMEAREYFQRKSSLRATVCNAYDDLASGYDAMVLEGAGSSAEVNLKAFDIVNMSMAFHAKAPVLIAGDIDRGGVFASFLGCMETYNERERRQVAGFIVNRFRGQASLLDPALDYVREFTGKPVLGVVPFLKDLGLPEEDSVSFKEMASQPAHTTGDKLQIALIDLPHISNFTDVDALREEADVELRIVRNVAELGRPHAVILPGSRNVPGDLKYLRERGLVQAILALAAEGKTEIVGICGGFQMLGKCIADPYKMESDGGVIDGMNLLPVTTTLEVEKTLCRTTARSIANGCTVHGYEIHHGITELAGALPAFADEQGNVLGARTHTGLVWGSYLHGVFDADEFRHRFLDDLRARVGFAPVAERACRYDLEPALDRLADVVRASLPIQDLYRKMGLK